MGSQLDTKAVVLPPEIWSLIGENLEFNTQTLYSLVRTCRMLRSLCTPFLYARQIIILNIGHEAGAPRKPFPAVLHHIKHLDLTLYIRQRAWDNNVYHFELVSALFLGMPNLSSFHWIDGFSEEIPNTTAFIEKPLLCLPEALKVLKTRDSLRELSFQLPNLPFFGKDPILNGFVSLRGFKNLTLLEIFGLHGNEYMPQWLFKTIATVLRDSPQLTTFGIGMHCEHDEPEKQAMYTTTIDQLDFFRGLCAEYYSLPDVAPLQLEVLRLGFGMFILPVESEENDAGNGNTAPEDNFLAKFVNLAELRTLHIFNGAVYLDVEFEDNPNQDPSTSESELDWTLLEGVKSLRQLSVTLLNEDALTFLNFGARCVEELIVTHHYFPRNEWTHRKFGEIATKLTTVVTWEQLDPTTEMTELEADMLAEHVLEWNFWEIPLQERTVLDRLGDGNISQIERLSICLDFSQQWERFQSHLKTLTNLTQLRLSSKTKSHIQYPSRSSSLWPNVTASKPLARNYAQLMKWTCPSLKLIRIGQWGWDVNIYHDGQISEVDIYDKILLREMERSEMMAVELFAMNPSIRGSGLPDPECWGKVYSDVDCAQWEEEEEEERFANSP